MTETQIAVVAAAFLIAGLVKGGVGMGLPPTAVAIMTLALPLSDALAIMTTIATNVWQAFYGGRFRPLLKRFWPMGLTIAAATLATAWGFGKLGSPAAVAWLGVVLALYGLIALVAWRPRTPRVAEPWANIASGVATGAVTGVTGIGAVPFLPYMQSLELTKDELVQALGILFVFIMTALTIALASQGAFNTGNLVGGLLANIPVFIGVWLGQRVRNAVSPETFRRIFLLGMLGIGLHMARGLL